MLNESNNPDISKILLSWYQNNKRDLPWRQTKDPYRIWISEIILQQTRVAQGWDYYIRFIQRFPDIASLANADEDEVLKIWQGLGYYSRARNLQTAAKDIMTRFGGKFPEEYSDILSLKGIGEYTAAAISSIVWNKAHPVVDGNVYRVLSRLFAIDTPIDSTKGKKEFAELAGMMMDKHQAELYNQAIMEFGALQCIPQSPDCEACPLSAHCQAYNEGDITRYPVKQGKTKTRNRYFNYLYIIYNNKTFLYRRTKGDIWAGLYEFPLIETERAVSFPELQQTDDFKAILGQVKDIHLEVVIEGIKHILSHQTLFTNFYRIRINSEPISLEQYQTVDVNDLEQYAIPRLIHKQLERLNE